MISYELEFRCVPIKRSLGLFDHYFIIFLEHEYHLGDYKKGTVLPKGTTLNSHLITKKSICQNCLSKILTDIKLLEDRRLFVYPVINCESLAIGTSIQSLLIINLSFVITLICLGKIIYGFILFLIIICCLLGWSKYNMSRTYKSKCEHLK